MTHERKQQKHQSVKSYFGRLITHNKSQFFSTFPAYGEYAIMANNNPVVTPVKINVNTHPKNTCANNFQLITCRQVNVPSFRIFSINPAPMVAPTCACVVDAGCPSAEQIIIIIADDNSMQYPLVDVM